MKFLKKLFHLPSPVELGRAKSNTLSMDFFTDEDSDEYTWEAWAKEVKEKHPIKYFFAETLRHWWAVRITMNIEQFWYWIRSHTYRRYHILDLRQPHTDSDDDYRWGWADPDSQMLFAVWNIFVSHVDQINASKFNYGTSEESLNALRTRIKEEEDCSNSQLEYLLEAKALYQYWTIDRKVNSKKKTSLLRDWHTHRQEDKKSGNKERWNALRKFEADFDTEEEEMMIRLMKIRRNLWS